MGAEKLEALSPHPDFIEESPGLLDTPLQELFSPRIKASRFMTRYDGHPVRSQFKWGHEIDTPETSDTGYHYPQDTRLLDLTSGLFPQVFAAGGLIEAAVRYDQGPLDFLSGTIR